MGHQLAPRLYHIHSLPRFAFSGVSTFRRGAHLIDGCTERALRRLPQGGCLFRVVREGSRCTLHVDCEVIQQVRYPEIIAPGDWITDGFTAALIKDSQRPLIRSGELEITPVTLSEVDTSFSLRRSVRFQSFSTATFRSRLVVLGTTPRMTFETSGPHRSADWLWYHSTTNTTSS